MGNMPKRPASTTKSMILHSAAKLFLQKGYKNTSMNELANVAEVSYGELFRIMKDKENIMCDLVAYVLEGQFESTSKLLDGKTDDKLLFYACETVLQLHMAESSEHIRELYTVAYSLPKSSQIIYNTITHKLEDIFKDHLPHLETKDFFELEIASAGIMRNFITVPCTMYFTMDRKVRRFLETTFLVYRVSDEKIDEAVKFVSQFDFKKIADDVIKSLLSYLEARI